MHHNFHFPAPFANECVLTGLGLLLKVVFLINSRDASQLITAQLCN